VSYLTHGPTLAERARDMSLPEPNPVHFVAPDYSSWTVHEVHDPAAERERSLIFVSTAGFRRVRSYPDDWRTLSAPELWALSWAR
jgi:hypothetical protein